MGDGRFFCSSSEHILAPVLCLLSGILPVGIILFGRLSCSLSVVAHVLRLIMREGVVRSYVISLLLLADFSQCYGACQCEQLCKLLNVKYYAQHFSSKPFHASGEDFFGKYAK